MPEATLDAYLAAKATLGDAQFTKDGAPKMFDINAALSAAGFDEISADERDAFDDMLPEDAEPAPTGRVRIRIIKAPMNPIPLYVHGVGHWRLWTNQTHELPVEAVEALKHSDIQFEIED